MEIKRNYNSLTFTAECLDDLRHQLPFDLNKLVADLMEGDDESIEGKRKYSIGNTEITINDDGSVKLKMYIYDFTRSYRSEYDACSDVCELYGDDFYYVHGVIYKGKTTIYKGRWRSLADLIFNHHPKILKVLDSMGIEYGKNAHVDEHAMTDCIF